MTCITAMFFQPDRRDHRQMGTRNEIRQAWGQCGEMLLCSLHIANDTLKLCSKFRLWTTHQYKSKVKTLFGEKRSHMGISLRGKKKECGRSQCTKYHWYRTGLRSRGTTPTNPGFRIGIRSPRLMVPGPITGTKGHVQGKKIFCAT